MNSQMRHLSKKPEFFGEYDSMIKNQDQLATIEKVGKDELSSRSKMHYIPHQMAVRKDAKTAKVRIVCDASAKAQRSNVGLKECLHAKPSLNPLLFDIFIRFYQQKVGLVAILYPGFFLLTKRLG